MDVLERCAIPAVVVLICFLAYSSQYLFLHIEPAPLDGGQILRFNVLVLAIFICYYRACSTDPGNVPPGWMPTSVGNGDSKQGEKDALQQRQRWCRKCEAYKPPRAHHCKTCKRCVLKMDHHCPWTSNCVSHRTLPHFTRFLVYAVVTMSYLEYFIALRVRVLWNKRNLPSYLGPSALQLTHLFILVVLNSMVLLALFVLLLRTLWCLGGNVTTIEGWEIERHETLVRRARYLGGYLEGPNGAKMRIVKQEFPYDIGIYSNIAQSMGGHLHTWLWPFTATPSVESGLSFEENEIEEPGTTWPPPDPDRMLRVARTFDPSDAFTQSMDPEEFRKRQAEDQLRRGLNLTVQRRQPFHARYSKYESKAGMGQSDYYYGDEDGEALDLYPSEDRPDEVDSKETFDEGEESWRNSEGERLADYGVDEDVEFYDEDDLPLSEIIKRKQQAGR